MKFLLRTTNNGSVLLNLLMLVVRSGSAIHRGAMVQCSSAKVLSTQFLSKRRDNSRSVLMSSKPASSSPRLLKARLQLAEAQGRLPPGVAAQIISPPSSEPVDIDSLLPPMSLVSQIREYNFTQVAEPQIAYDPLAAEAQLYRQPVRWLRRNMELLFPLAGFVASVLVDVHRLVPSMPVRLSLATLSSSKSSSSSLSASPSLYSSSSSSLSLPSSLCLG